MIARVGPLSGDQEATQIFIIYMHDIVLEISFLEINPKFEPEQLEAFAKKCEYIIHISKIPMHG